MNIFKLMLFQKMKISPAYLVPYNTEINVKTWLWKNKSKLFISMLAIFWTSKGMSSFQYFKQATLFPCEDFDGNQLFIDALKIVLNLDLFVDKVASFSIRTISLCQINSTFLSFVLWIDLLISSQLMWAMSKLASLLVRAESALYKPFAKLGLLFIAVHRRLSQTVRKLTRGTWAWGCWNRAVHLFW